MSATGAEAGAVRGGGGDGTRHTTQRGPGRRACEQPRGDPGKPGGGGGFGLVVASLGRVGFFFGGVGCFVVWVFFGGRGASERAPPPSSSPFLGPCAGEREAGPAPRSAGGRAVSAARRGAGAAQRRGKQPAPALLRAGRLHV